MLARPTFGIQHTRHRRGAGARRLYRLQGWPATAVKWVAWTSRRRVAASCFKWMIRWGMRVCVAHVVVTSDRRTTYLYISQEYAPPAERESIAALQAVTGGSTVWPDSDSGG
jgi:hypothetical protein